MTQSLQTPFDIAVVIPTLVRPSLVQAVHSVFAQRFGGRIQVVIGIDRCVGDRAVLDRLAAECPSHMAVTVIDLGYSTSVRNGGLYPSHYGGALKTILSYAANSRAVAYLDDDNWYAPDHVATMLPAVAGKAWGFALRNFVDDNSDRHVCVDSWESVGPGRGVYTGAHGGFVDTNCYVLDKLACHDVFPEWAVPRYPGGTGADRQVFEKLRDRPWGTNNAPTVHYRIRLAKQHFYQLWRMKCAGVDLASFMAAADIPGDDVWQRCIAFERRSATSALLVAGEQ